MKKITYYIVKIFNRKDGNLNRVEFTTNLRRFVRYSINHEKEEYFARKCVNADEFNKLSKRWANA